MAKRAAKRPIGQLIARDFQQNKWKYLMILPVVVYFILFAYKPMYGIIIAFKNYRPTLGIMESPWVGLDQFTTFFKDPYFWRLLRNTFTISGLSILFGFPAPILLALLINEIRCSWFKRTVQTVSYMPYFISVVVMCGLLKAFCQTDGVFNDLIAAFGGTRENLLSAKENFYAIYVGSGIWQSIGWDSIIYLAALSGIDPSLYEAAIVDGASRIQRIARITLPSIMPIAVTMLILSMGSIMSAGFDQVFNLYSPQVYDVGDILDTYVYRRGLVDMSYSFSTAVGLFKSVVGLILVVAVNVIAKRLSPDHDAGLW